MKALRGIIENLRTNLSAEKLFSTAPLVTFRPHSCLCPVCGTKTNVVKSRTKLVATLDIGAFAARELPASCPRCGVVVGSEELRALVPERCNIGYDVMVHVGIAFFLRSRTNEEIVRELQDKNVRMCPREVSYLAKKFIIYLALLHTKVRSRTRDLLSLNGGYILHLDGTCEGESPHLISVLDGITEIVLDNIKVPSENTEDLIPFLQGIQGAYGDPVAVVSDMGKAILLAVKEVFKRVPRFICHFHFLKSLGKELFGAEYEIVRKRLKHHGIQGVLRKKVRILNKSVAASPETTSSFVESLQTEDAGAVAGLEALPQLMVQTLLLWALAGTKQGQGCGFPFDQPHLIVYQRLLTAYELLRQFKEQGLFKTEKETKLYTTIRRAVLPVVRDASLKKAATAMEEKVRVFARLRAAMRITLPQNKRGLNDNGEIAEMKKIEQGVSSFRNQLAKNTRYSKDTGYRKMIEHIDKYWDLLFCDPLEVETKAGRILIQPQRTNNLLEQFFRAFMRAYRKKNGFQAMAKVLKAMLADTPLVMNLRNKAFMDILLDGKPDLAQRFADVEAEQVREQMNKALEQDDQFVCTEIKKVINIPEFPHSLTSLLCKQSS